MGRVHTARRRALLSAGAVVLLPGAALVSRGLHAQGGVPAVSLTLAVVVAYLLCVGSAGAPVALLGFTLHGVLVLGEPLSVQLVGVAAAQAAVTVAAVRFLEARFAHHGPVRSTVVMAEYLGVVAVLLPLATTAVGALLGEPSAPGPFAASVLASSLGVVSLTAGIRMLVMGERSEIDAEHRGAVALAVVVSGAAIAGTVAAAGVEGLASTQVVMIPVLAVALLVGTAGYAVALAATTLLVLVPIAVLGGPDGWVVSTASQVTWLAVGAAGLVLATDGDRRRATATEFRSFYMRSATPTLSVNAADGTVTRANDAVAELLGSRVRDLLGRSVTEVLAAADFEAAVGAVLDGHTEEVLREFPLRAAPGDERWVRCVVTRVWLQGPQHDVVQVQFLDLTAERDRAAALKRSNDALERFGRRVTHDLKQPLSAVAAYAGTLAEHGARLDPAVVAEMYGRLEAVAKRAVTQLDDTFDSAAGPASGSQTVKLHEVVAAVVGVIDIDLTRAGGAVDSSLSVTRMQADPSLLRQVLLNLVTNSLKYTGDDTVPRVRIASRVRGAGVEVTVTDNGTGIPGDMLERVFERGRRLDPTRADGRGHGLADSREMVEAAGGWLRAEPWPDGARFVLWLPDPGVAGAQPSTRVLLVDDEPDQLTLLQRRLELQPSIDVVGTASTVDEAVEATRELRPDVVLLDRWLRGVDGLEGVVALARAHPDVRIVLLTADVTPDLPARARSGGVVTTLDKALSDEALVAGLVGAVG